MSQDDSTDEWAPSFNQKLLANTNFGELRNNFDRFTHWLNNMQTTVDNLQQRVKELEDKER